MSLPRPAFVQEYNLKKRVQRKLSCIFVTCHNFRHSSAFPTTACKSDIEQRVHSILQLLHWVCTYRCCRYPHLVTRPAFPADGELQAVTVHVCLPQDGAECGSAPSPAPRPAGCADCISIALVWRAAVMWQGPHQKRTPHPEHGGCCFSLHVRR